MTQKCKLTIDQAATQLKEAVQANKAELTREIAGLRSRLEELLKFVEPTELGDELKHEVEKLARLFDAQKSQKKTTTKRSHIKTVDKRQFVEKTLKEKKSEMPKSELLEFAGKEFGVEPALTFLDTALKDKKFKTEKKGNKAYVYFK